MRLTKAEKAVFARLGRKGGKNRATKLSPERRAEIARMGGKAKGAKAKRPKLTFTAVSEPTMGAIIDAMRRKP